MPGVHAGGHGHAPAPPQIGRGDAEDEAPPDALRWSPDRAAADAGAQPDRGDALLRTEGVTFAYQDGTVALRELSVSIARGARLAILGANGSGKSTLFLTLNGILKPRQGRVLLAGEPVRYDRAGLNDLRRRVGLVFQDPDSQLFAASVRQDISFGPINLGLPESEVRARVEAAVRDTQIEELADRPTHLLSYGQKKRVATAGVLAMDPAVVTADEPTAGLDPEATARLLALLDRLHALRRTICISTHDLELALAWADEVLVVRRGELLAAGPPTSVLSEPELLRAARLVQPIVLDTFGRLRAAGFFAPDVAPPRTAATLAALVAAGRPARHISHTPPDPERKPHMSKVVLDVPEISCEHCSRAITKALQPQEGVRAVRVDVPTQKVHLEFDESAITLDRVKEILAEEEYPVEAATPA